MKKLALLLCASMAGCAQESVSHSSDEFQVEVLVVDDRGEGLSGVPIEMGGSMFGETTEEGVLSASLRGAVGTSHEAKAHCLNGYVSAQNSASITLAHTRDLEGKRAPIRLTLRCQRLERRVAVLVDTHGRAGAAVWVDGQEAGHTDRGGFAHLLLEGRPGALHEIEVFSPDAKQFLPGHYAFPIEIDEQDEHQVVAATFDKKAPKRRKRKRSPKEQKPMRPVKIL